MIAIDLGSNTIRCIEYDGTHWGKSFEKIVRTAENLHITQKIGNEAVDRICKALDEAQNVVDFGQHPIVAVTTAAMRMAINREDVLERIYRHTGIAFSLIEGDIEARLTLLAVQNRLEKLSLFCNRFLLADIGGGSTELIYCSDTLIDSVSLDMGIVTMSEKAKDVGMLETFLNLFEKKVREYLTSLNSVEKPEFLILTAGTPTTIAAYRMGMNYFNYDPQKVNGHRLNLVDCERVYLELMDMDEKQRAQYVGVGRELLIAAGIMMVQRLFIATGIEEGIVVDDGLREGVALNYFLQTVR